MPKKRIFRNRNSMPNIKVNVCSECNRIYTILVNNSENPYKDPIDILRHKHYSTIQWIIHDGVLTRYRTNGMNHDRKRCYYRKDFFPKQVLTPSTFDTTA